MVNKREGEIATLYGSSSYRKDVQGLRALGAILIMVFHIWFNKVSGGVDVFIVVSGFLMTSLFIKGWLASGSKSIFEFWSKIIIRIAPSAYTVLLITVAVGYFILPPSTISAFINEAIAAILHLENLMLIRRSVDYLASGISPSPIQQFWALSVQVQFYAILPFLLIPLALFSHFKKNPAPMIFGLSILLAISFIYAVYKVNQDPDSAYFNTFARGWEFLAGGLLFLLSPWLKLSKKASSAMALMGILMVFSSAFFIPRGAGYPGAIALFPVLAAIFILLSGLSEQYQNKALSSKVMVLLGNMSFTIYLWHWPILIFYKEIFNATDVAIAPGLGIITISILLAYLTSKVESYVKSKVGRKVIYGYALGFLYLIPSAILVYHLRADLRNINQEVIAEWSSYDFSGNSLNQAIYEESQVNVSRRELISARNNLPEPYGTDCHQSEEGYEVKTCDFGDLEAERKVVLVGGSHVAQWLPALDEIGSKNGFKVINMTKSACPFGPLESTNASCFAWNEKALQEIVDISPDLVVTNSTRTQVRREYVPNSYVRSWRNIAEHGISIIGIRDNPRFGFDIPECVHRNSDNHYNCAVRRADYLEEVNPALAYRGLIDTLDMTEFLCTSEFCPVTFNGYLMYRDQHHIHVPYVRLMGKAFEMKLQKIHPELFALTGMR